MLRRGIFAYRRGAGVFARIVTLGAWMALGAVPVAMAQDAPTGSDQARILDYARTELREWINDPVIIFAIKKQNELHRSISQPLIDRLDGQWRHEGTRGILVADLLGRQASVIARDRRDHSNGVVKEVIVMDARGLNVAISDPTSHYFHGETAAWQKTFPNGADGAYVGGLEIDESTGTIQANVSLTVSDPKTGDPIGAVTLGVSLEKLIN